MIKEVKGKIDEYKSEFIRLSDYILANPELGYKEFKACSAHVELLKTHGFQVEEGFMGMDTAFKAVYKSSKEGPTVAYMAEYDALPEIGHGCGHNLLGTTSTAAGIILSKYISEIGGTVIVFGTPAEETAGAKVEFAASGVFAEVNIALMAHPADNFYKSGSSLALEPVQFTFKGRSAHAAAAPEKGINALDAAINTFNNINALREHVRTDARIHGIIKEGGAAPNIVPELATAQFYIRAADQAYLDQLSEKIKNCARGASLAAGTELEITNFEPPFANLVTNQHLSEVFNHRILNMGVENIYDQKEGFGSLDAGNVSHVCPTIHPYFGITEHELTVHSREFRDATCTEKAYDSMLKTIGALVLTAIDVIKDEQLLQDINEEFAAENIK